MKLVFYVIDLPNPEIQHIFDAIRLVCNPLLKNRAHITVRGPYRQRYGMPAANARLSGETIEIDGTGTFFEDGQNTVFLTCKGSALKDVWKKRDFAYAPHLTLYDGRSREFATRLFEVIDGARPQFTFKAGELKVMISRPGQRGLGAAIHLGDNDLSDVFGEALKVSELEDLSDDARLKLVGHALARLDKQTTMG